MKIPDDNEQDSFDINYWQVYEKMFTDVTPDFNEWLTDFYYRFLILKKGYCARKRLYTEFSQLINDYPSKQHGINDFFADLQKFARLYIEIKVKCPDGAIEEAFFRFRQLDLETAIPLLLWLYERYHSKIIDKQAFLRMTRNIESFVLRRSIMTARTNGYGLDFADAIKHAENENDLKSYLIQKVWPMDEAIYNALKNFNFYGRERKKCKLVLSEIEANFGSKEKVDLANATIEHIMPQTLTQNWSDMLGSDAEKVHSSLLHTLGNLTLTPYNSELGNLPFIEKQEILKESKISLNKYFETCPTWTETDISERTARLCARLTDLWGRPNQNGNGSYHSNTSSKQPTAKRIISAVKLNESLNIEE